jgi:trans-2,3-dihydro-3-hydroxyanthranilate isomerase
MARRFPYVLVDVFTDKPLAGNALAVFTDARGLETSEMQSIARETSLSETTFIVPGDPATEASRGVRVRIFTVVEELPFAGHPTLGTSFVITKARGTHEVVLDLDVGPVPVSFQPESGGARYGEMRQREPSFGHIHERAIVARAIGIAERDLAVDIPIQTVSTGLPFIMVPIASLASLRDLRPDWTRLQDYLERSDGKFFYFVSRETVDPQNQVHARMLFYNGEDPATGSAAGPCVAWMVRYGLAKPDVALAIEQGLEMHRPSRIIARAGLTHGRVSDVRVGGSVVEVGSGELVV